LPDDPVEARDVRQRDRVVSELGGTPNEPFGRETL
jgi:hypothetical protein